MVIFLPQLMPNFESIPRWFIDGKSIWNIERLIWTGCYKNDYDEKCLFDQLGKDIINKILFTFVWNKDFSFLCDNNDDYGCENESNCQQHPYRSVNARTKKMKIKITKANTNGHRSIISRAGCVF